MVFFVTASKISLSWTDESDIVETMDERISCCMVFSPLTSFSSCTSFSSFTSFSSLTSFSSFTEFAPQ